MRIISLHRVLGAVFIFLWTLLGASTLWLHWQAEYEDAVFIRIAKVAITAPDRKLADFAQVRDDWDFYRKQTPPGYPVNWFNYRNVTYTNWNKIPYLMPAAKQVLRWGIGDKVNELSLRAYVIKKYRVQFLEALALWVILSIAGVVSIARFRSSNPPS